MAEEGIRALAASLAQGGCRTRKNLEARSDALYGAWLAGIALGSAGMALHHKLCHVLGGFGLPHAETHSIVLPHAMQLQRRRRSRGDGARSARPGEKQRRAGSRVGPGEQTGNCRCG